MDTTTIIILAVACLVLGVVLDSLVRLLLKKDTGTAEKLPRTTSQAPGKGEPAPEAAGKAASQPGGLQEIVRLWDESDTHILVVELEGQHFHQARELPAELRTQLELTLERLANWLRKPIPVPSSAPETAPAGFVPSGDGSTASAAALNSLSEPVLSAAQPVKKISLNPVDVVANALQPNVAKSYEMKSLAEQVDEILQEKLLALRDSPLGEKKIRLLDLPGGGLVVMVGMNKYDGVDAVPDEDVRAILHEAVDEWGKRASRRKA